jgi:thymidylate synthase (FAD)
MCRKAGPGEYAREHHDRKYTRTHIPKRVEVLGGQGFVELEDWYGDDLTIVNAARQSFARSSLELTEADRGLINMLMRDRHGTPFEMVDFRFNVKAPIIVAREWFRHRMASYNEMSGRYSKLPAEWYVHNIEDIRTQKGSPGRYKFEPLDAQLAEAVQREMEDQYERCWLAYQKALDKGVAREVARTVLPQGMMTRFTFKVNLRSLLNFVSLRSPDTAMKEIRVYSQAMEKMVEEVVPEAYNAFLEYGYIAP